MSKGQETRKRILQEGILLAAKEGAHAISIRKVAERVKLSPMAIYRHFPDKAQLQAAMLVEAFSVFERYLRETLSERQGVQGLKNLANGFILFALEKPGHFELLFLSVSNPRQSLTGKLIRDAGQPTLHLLRDAVDSCLRSEELEAQSLDHLTLDTLAFCVGHAALHLSKNLNVSKAQAVKDFNQAFDRYIDRSRPI